MAIGSKTVDRGKTISFALKKSYKVAPGIFLLLVFANILTAVLGYIPGIISRTVLNMLQTGGDWEKIIYVVVLTVPTALLIQIINAFHSVLSLHHSDLFEQHINEEIFEKNARLDISCYDTPRYYDTISDLARSKRSFDRLKTQAMRFGAAIINFVVNVLVVARYSSFIYVLIMLVFILPAIYLSNRYESKKSQYEITNRGNMRKVSYYAGIVTGRTSAQEIRFYNLSDYFIKRYEQSLVEYRNGIREISLKGGAIDSVAKVLPGIGTGIVLIVSAVSVVNGSMLIGDFFFLLTVISALQMHLTQIAFNLSTSDVNCYAIKKYEDYLALPELSNKGKRILERIDRIEFRNVTFQYPYSDEPVLNHVSFVIDPCKKTALVGVNGAGKSTIAKLLMHFYDVDDGTILINDNDIKEYELVALRRKIASVFQNYSIYSLSLGFNITLTFTYSDAGKRMETALRNAGLGELVDSVKNNYDLELSKRFSNDGIILSGGQNQRVAIARSLFNNACYYILDEPSSALDPIAEAQILSQFIKAYAGSGILMITHRLSNTELMDQIIVLENGHVIESGNHENLIMQKGRYCELFYMQNA